MTQLPHFAGQGTGQAAAPRASRLFSYQTAGQLAIALDYGLIVIASVAAGVGYHLLIHSNLPDLKPYLGIGECRRNTICIVIRLRGTYRPNSLFPCNLRSDI